MQAPGLTLIEDDIHALLLPKARRPRPIAALVPEQTIYVANTAKLLAPALRVSYVAVPTALVEGLLAALHGSIWMTPPLGAELATHWIESGVADRLVALRQREAAARQRLAATALRGFAYRAHPAAYHGWLTLPEAWRCDAFVTRLAERGVAVTAGEAFVVGRAAAPHAVRLCLGAPWTDASSRTPSRSSLARSPNDLRRPESSSSVQEPGVRQVRSAGTDGRRVHAHPPACGRSGLGLLLRGLAGEEEHDGAEDGEERAPANVDVDAERALVHRVGAGEEAVDEA